MRIDGLSNTPAEVRTNVADLLGRLDAGDVIKAKVLEITPNDVVLRLFDGSVLKAAIAEGLEAKVGQALTLTVTSKAEGTLFLETVKDPTQLSNIKPDLLKNMLEALHIKPDTKNMELAAEFLKAGITVSTDQFDKASGLMDSFKGLNAEKAVFIASKGLQADQMKLELLAKLLDGDLKLGEQIKELQTALNNIARTIGKSSSKDVSASVIFDAVESVLIGTAATFPATSTDSPDIVNTAATKSTSIDQQGDALTTAANTGKQGMAGTSAETAVQHGAQNASTKVSIQQGTTNTSAETATQHGATNTSAKIVNQQGTINTSATTAFSEDLTTSTAKPNVLNANGTLSPDIRAGITGNAEQPANVKSAQVSTDMTKTSTLQLNAHDAAGDDLVSKPINLIGALLNDGINISNKDGANESDQFSKLKDAIKELFVNIASDKLATDLDVNKMQMDLNKKLDMLKTAIQAPVSTGLAGTEAIMASSALLDESVKLMNQLNNNNILYYQLPVNLSGHNTTAELYVMKRKHGKKRIDPHNTVMFVSLDTKNLGRIETLLDVKGNSVSINLRTEKQHINDFARENIKHLYTGLADCGYKLVDMKYSLIDSATPPIKLENLLSKMLERNHSKVDMRI